MTILTIAEGKIPISKTNEFEKTFRLAKKEALPTGLITSSLLKNTNTLGTYRIQTAWENQEALEKMRSTTQTPKAIEIFQSVGVTPTLEIYELVENIP